MTSSDTRTLRTVEDLVAAGLVDAGEATAVHAVAETYAVALTATVANLIDRTDPADPIARQYVPDPAELVVLADESGDPIGDAVHSPVSGIVHRYPDRVLLKVVSICPVYCRFCFRREMVGPGRSDPLTSESLAAAFAYIADHPEIWEVIVTGGDPLVMSPRRVAEIGAALAAIDHVRIIRWHTRVPVVAPDTVTEDLVEALAAPTRSDRAVYVAVHANHARELTGPARDAIRRLHRAGIGLVSQTVLLRGVNDTTDALGDLMRAFVEAGVKPYYLHLLDKAPGTSHFRVPLDEARTLVQGLRGRISGLCQPTLVIDIPGGHGKAVATPSDVVAAAADDGHADQVLVRDRLGGYHRYGC